MRNGISCSVTPIPSVYAIAMMILLIVKQEM